MSAHRPAAVVVVLDRPASAGAALSVVLRVHGLCSGLGILMSVATGSAPARRALHAAADRTGVRLVVHARRHTAVTGTAFAAAA
ncbi:hypothetical protein MTQ10_14475 [Streptomyces sp. XM83C]|uniref:hypothetical protein n=1 Tax=Streptomyces sp. XM83C TaxID=2929781 RepID=UPI001FFC23CD|nr:hypothetical protein [Streptomyces sp. XM83C]MCK1820785.1 hypothetical protein [Streptomyces sp. XM83C]